MQYKQSETKKKDDDLSDDFIAEIMEEGKVSEYEITPKDIGRKSLEAVSFIKQ